MTNSMKSGRGISTATVTKVKKLASRRKYLAQSRLQALADKTQARAYVASCKGAQSVIQGLALSVQQQIHAKIASIVTNCLQVVFEEPYEFEIRFEQKRGKTSARMLFKRNGVEMDPMTASGGGVVDVACFALRVACVIQHRPKLRPVLFLDEPFKFVSAKYRPRVRSLLESLSKDLGIQFIIVTHIQELQCGNVITIE